MTKQAHLIISQSARDWYVWVQKHAGSEQYCPLKALQRFHQSVAQPKPEPDSYVLCSASSSRPYRSISLHTGPRWIDGELCVFSVWWSLLIRGLVHLQSHSLVETDNNPVVSASRLPHVDICCMWSCSILNRRAEPDMRSQQEMNMLSYLYWAWKCSWTKLCRSRGCCVLDEVKLEGCSSEVDPCRHGGKQYLVEK